MSGSMKRNRFIPFRKADLVEMCVKDLRLAEAEVKEFKEFCQILEALFHFEFHTRLEKLKTYYGPFNPDADTRKVYNYSEPEKKNFQKKLVSEMTAVLNAANFEKITAEDLQQALSDNLYFKNLDNNAGVFYHLIDTAEEEEFKEAVLAYYFLLTAKDPMTKKELDHRIENWLAEKWDCHIDFEIGDAVNKLQRLNLIQQDAEILQSVPLSEAKQQLDTIWDNFFTYNSNK